LRKKWIILHVVATSTPASQSIDPGRHHAAIRRHCEQSDQSPTEIHIINNNGFDDKLAER